MIFLIESIVLCLIFTLTVPLYGLRDPLAMIDSYPPAIAALYLLSACAETLRIFNRADTFLSGFVTSFLLWLVVDWYDALVIDCLWFCHSKRCIIPGTEDMTAAYHDYGFHIQQSCIGIFIGLPVCLLTGGLTALLAVIWPPTVLL